MNGEGRRGGDGGAGQLIVEGEEERDRISEMMINEAMIRAVEEYAGDPTGV